MKIIKQSIGLIWITPKAERNIEYCGRISYKSENLITSTSAKDFIKKIIELGHESVLEHASASIKIITNRGISHEIVRHRLASYTQESTRYCNYAKNKFNNELTFIEQNYSDIKTYCRWTTLLQRIELDYLRMVNKNNIKPEIARGILPNDLKTELAMTANFREWRHFLKLRTSPKAHPQMQELANMIWNVLKAHAPTVFETL